MVDLPLLKQLIQLLHWILVSLHEWLSSGGLGESWAWGLAIIGLTIVVRLVLFPLTWKQFSSAQAMQAIQPKMKELQQRHKGDRAKLQQETMKLYQEHRVNPFASCLPIVLQLPVFISLYYAIKGTGYLDKAMTGALADASFLWIPHLGDPDPYYILLVLYVVSQLVSTELMLTAQTDKSQKMIMRAMPIMFVFFLFRFPAGLFVYWVTTNLWTIGQQIIIRKVMKPKDLATMSARPARRSRFMEAVMSSQDGRAKTREELVAERRAEKAAKAGTAGKGAAKPPGASSGARKTGRKPPPGKRKPGQAAGKGKARNGPASG
ncbi:MAG: membrane protein insertase YidC [Thermoleophilia bacterium]